MAEEKTIRSSRRVSLEKQLKIQEQLSTGLIDNIVVVRTLVGTFIGCLLTVSGGVIRLRVFSGVDRVFIVIRIPIAIIVDIFRFPCP